MAKPLSLEVVINGLTHHLTRTPKEVNGSVKALLTTLVDHPGQLPFVLRGLSILLAPDDKKPALRLVSNVHTLQRKAS